MKKHKFVVFTGTRADYGILFWLMKDLQSCGEVDLQLVVSGSHLSTQHGSTYKFIENDGFSITKKVDMLLAGETDSSTAKSVAIAILGYTEALGAIQADRVIVLGDRYEAFAMAQAAFLMKVPLVHLHGGEVTEGANDERMRHAITKLSDVHFTSTERHRQRVIQLGETPASVFNVGAPGLEHIHRSSLPGRSELSNTFKFNFQNPYIVISFHPVTNSDDSGAGELRALLDACGKLKEVNFVVSMSNADADHSIINELLQQFADAHDVKTLLQSSFGHFNFLAVLQNAELVLGNSSSGIIEAPSLNTISVDVGIRQQGRERAKSVLAVGSDLDAIDEMIEKALKLVPCESYFDNPYDKGGSSALIIEHLLAYQTGLVKRFHDVPMECVP